MKYIISLAILFVSAQATAQEVSRETAAAQQHIERVRPNGKVETFDGDEWIIVKKGPKKAKPKVAPAPVETKVVEKEVVRTVEKTVTVTKIQKNRLSLVGGIGATGKVDYSFDSSAGSFRAKSDIGAVGGLLYQRKVSDKISIGVQGQTNKTGSLLLGLDF